MLKNKKILMTGLTGKLGGTLADALVKDNELWGFARFSRPGQLEYWQNAGVKTVVGDFARTELAGLPDDFDYVLHVAANCRPSSVEQGLQDNSDGVGILMSHCRKAKAFLHVSTIGVMAQKQLPAEPYNEDDDVGGQSIRFYTGSKLAGEGVARAFCRMLDLPTIICRMCVQYGTYQEGGQPGIILKMLLEGKPIPLQNGWDHRASLVSNDDVVRFIEPSLAAASVPATTINWGGDINVSWEEAITYLAELAGVEPRWEHVDKGGWPSFPTDPSRRIAITGPCQVHWKDGLKAMYEGIHERLRAEIARA